VYVFLHILSMEIMSLSEARKQLSSLLEQVETTHERVTVTRNGRPAAVLISPDDLEALEETLDLLSDPAAMKRLRAGETAIAAGDVLDETQLRAFLDRQVD